MKPRVAGALILAALALCVLWSRSRSAPVDAADVERGDLAEQTEAPILIGAPERAAGDVSDVAEAPPLEPRAEPTIRGLVVDDQNRPQARMEVELRSLRVLLAWTRTERNGRFQFGAIRAPVPDDLEIAVRPDRESIYRSQVRDVEPGGDVRIVLEAYPHAVLEFVDAGTGRGLRSRYIQVVHRGEDGESRQGTWSSTSVPEDPEPFPYQWVVRVPEPGEQIQVRAQGYAPSPWVDAPTEPDSQPRRIAMRADPGSIGALVATIRTDDGAALDRVALLRFHGSGDSGWTSQDLPLEGGRITWPLDPGRHRIRLGGDGHDAPDQLHEWYLPETLDVEVGYGETVHREVVLRRGGFLRLPQAHGAVVLTDDSDDALPFFAHPRSDHLFGPLPPGTWRYSFSRDGKTYAGTAEVVAGEIVTSQPQPVEDKVDDR